MCCQNKTKVGLKVEYPRGTTTPASSQNKTKVGLKGMKELLYQFHHESQNKTKVGLKAKRGGCSQAKSHQVRIRLR